MKKLILMLVFALATVGASAQAKMNWSVDLGLGASTWMGDGSDGAKALFNQKIGVGVDIPMTGLISFKTGLYWSSKGVKVSEKGDFGDFGSKLDVKVNQNYFQMPVLAAFHFGTGQNFDVVVSGGAYMAVGVCGKTEAEVDDLTVSVNTFGDSKIGDVKMQGLHRFDAGIQTGVALDFQSWTVGVDGEFGLTKIAKGDSPRNLAFFVNVGYKF